MSDKNKRINWMLDETIAQSRPRDWEKITFLEKTLIQLMGNESFDHVLVHPLNCLKSLVPELRKNTYSCIIDLSGWLGDSISELFPNIPIESAFALSRVRDVSSPKLSTTGYLVSMTSDEIAERKPSLDLSRPLIIDDVSFSGWTSIKTMEIWGIDPQVTTHAFLIANKGTLGEGIYGARGKLEKMGSRVIAGYEIETPFDDGWHLKDLYSHPNISSAFELSLVIQKAISKHGLDSEVVKRFFSDERVAGTLFPEHFSSQEVIEMKKEGRFVLLDASNLGPDSIHARNPFLWASPYFQEHVDLDKITRNREFILEILNEINRLTLDPEVRIEAVRELKRYTRDVGIMGKEGPLFTNKER